MSQTAPAGLRRRDIRRSAWFEEAAEFLGVEPALLVRATAGPRVEGADAAPDVRQAREALERRFMSPGARALLRRVQAGGPQATTDAERSASWREYVFLCVNAEKRAFERMAFYDALVAGVVRPLLARRRRLRLVDYGCGSSLLTRMVAQDVGDRVETLSVDVCRYAVEFSVARNRLYSAAARGLVLDDVGAALGVRDVDVLLAYGVFEHLPDSTRQIGALVDALGPDGILIENYAGHSAATPHKSDTASAYACRDRNLDLLRERLGLLHGALPPRQDGRYAADDRVRVWIAGDPDGAIGRSVRAALRRELGLRRRLARALARRLHGPRGAGPWRLRHG